MLGRKPADGAAGTNEPHFVFNCLNSIQECIVTEKYGEASKYLNKFSKLFRMVLNNSGKNFVNLDEEKGCTYPLP